MKKSLLPVGMLALVNAMSQAAGPRFYRRDGKAAPMQKRFRANVSRRRSRYCEAHVTFISSNGPLMKDRSNAGCVESRAYIPVPKFSHKQRNRHRATQAQRYHAANQK